MKKMEIQDWKIAIECPFCGVEIIATKQNGKYWGTICNNCKVALPYGTLSIWTKKTSL